MNRFKLLFSVFLLLIFACNRENKIKQVKFWKYSDGKSSSDILNFNSKDYRVKKDTIYKLDIPLYKIENYEQRFLSGDQVLVIKEIQTGKTARYVSK